MWSKIVDPLIGRRWFLRACTGCKLGFMLCSVEVQISIIRLFTNLTWWSAVSAVTVQSSATGHVS